MKDVIEKALEIIDSYETAHDLDLILKDKTSSFIAYLFEMAACKKSKKLCEDLLRRNLDPTSRSEFGGSAMRAAVWAGDYYLVKLFLDWGVDVNHTNNGESLLLIAARRNDVHVVQLLLEQGADQNLRVHKDANSPLFTAACASEQASRVHVAVRITKLLLKYKPDFKWKKNTLALQKLCSRGNFWWAKMIIEECNISVKSVKKFTSPSNGNSLLRLALQFQNIEFAQYLIDKGAPLRDEIGMGYMLNTVLENGSATLFDFLVSNDGIPKRGHPDHKHLRYWLLKDHTIDGTNANSIRVADWADFEEELIEKLEDWFDLENVSSKLKQLQKELDVLG